MITQMIWLNEFDERQRKQIEFSAIYENDFHHGANGHNDMMIIAKMARMLSALEKEIDSEKFQSLMRSADEQ